jgi:hypothetical protein
MVEGHVARAVGVQVPPSAHKAAFERLFVYLVFVKIARKLLLTSRPMMVIDVGIRIDELSFLHKSINGFDKKTVD